MDMDNSLFSDGSVPNEQVARQLFEMLGEQATIMVIMDRNQNLWPNNSEEFSKLNIDESFLKTLCEKADGGQEPVITQINDFSIIVSQLATDKTNCGYLALVLPKYSPESTLANIDLIETLIKQVNLIAKLIEQNNLLYESLRKYHPDFVGLGAN